LPQVRAPSGSDDAFDEEAVIRKSVCAIDPMW
jgi:hypothetical protein